MDTGLRPPRMVEVLETQERFSVRRYDELSFLVNVSAYRGIEYHFGRSPYAP
jgi:hypothetical protein